MRKFGCGLLMVLGIIAAAFVALLLFGQTLPDAKPQPKAGAATPAPTPGKAATSHGGILAVPVTGELVAEIDGVLNAAVEAEAAERIVEMRGIAGEQHAAGAE